MHWAYYRNRLLFLAGAIVCFVLFWLAAGLFGIPAHRGIDGSLLMQRGSVGVVLVTAVVLMACAAIGTLIAGTVRFDAGLFTAAVGLTALTFRSGTMRDVLLAAADSGVYLILLTELVILYGLIGLAWSVLWLIHRQGLLAADEFREGVEDVEDPLSQKLLAAATHAVVMGLLVIIIAQTTNKGQVIAAVGIASWLGAWTAHYMFPVRPSVWFWTAPLLVGAVGYGLAFTSPGDWQIGQVPYALSRPLPLDYAALGPVGGLIGYWMSRRASALAAEGTEEEPDTAAA